MSAQRTTEQHSHPGRCHSTDDPQHTTDSPERHSLTLNPPGLLPSADEDIALLGIEQEDGTRGAELVAEKVYASIARELLPRELERAGILLDCLRL